MSAQLLLKSILESQKSLHPDLSEDEFFEVYCADNILLNYDLSTEEIRSGIVDGPRDAGIDSAFVFINKQLLTEDFQLGGVKQPIHIEIIIIQSKNQDNFKEGPLDKLCSSLPLLLGGDLPEERLNALFKAPVVSIFLSFINAMKSLASEFPTISIKIYYCCKGDRPNDVVTAKADTLKKILSPSYKDAELTFLGANELYERSGKQKRLVKQLPVLTTPLSGQNSYVALCSLANYIKFISDEDGTILTRMFESNVRAYQGDVEVNKEIAASIVSSTPGVDFWWLNNGVTIVADQAQFMNNSLNIENPLIVNGLQTSHLLHEHASSLSASDARQVLVRVIVEKDRVKRDEVIRATNRQTSITHSSFRATEPVHRKIEDYLKTIGFFYDRRKNQHKRNGAPANKIISIDRLAQAVLSVLKQEPHTARARPTTALKNESDYKSIFCDNPTSHPLEMYGNVTCLMSAIDDYFKSISAPENRTHRTNLRFHSAMVLAWAINGGKTLPAPAIKSLDLNKASLAQIKSVVDWVFSEFDKAGANDRIAKSSDFTAQLVSAWNHTLTSPP